MENEIEALKAEKAQLEQEVDEMKMKYNMLERRNEEMRVADEQRHTEEVTFLKKTNQQLKVNIFFTTVKYLTINNTYSK